MSFSDIKDFLNLNNGSEALKEHFETHCEWCWGHGYEDCVACLKDFNKIYRPIRIKELTEKYKAGK